MGKRIFAGDWRACQEEHLRAVVAAGDARNEASLVRVLQDIGFDAVRLAALGISSDSTDPADAVEASMESPAPAVAETGDPPAAASDEESEAPAAVQAEASAPPVEDRGHAGDEGHDEGEEGDDGNAAPAQLSLF